MHTAYELSANWSVRLGFDYSTGTKAIELVANPGSLLDKEEAVNILLTNTPKDGNDVNSVDGSQYAMGTPWSVNNDSGGLTPTVHAYRVLPLLSNKKSVVILVEYRAVTVGGGGAAPRPLGMNFSSRSRIIRIPTWFQDPVAGPPSPGGGSLFFWKRGAKDIELTRPLSYFSSPTTYNSNTQISYPLIAASIGRIFTGASAPLLGLGFNSNDMFLKTGADLTQTGSSTLVTEYFQWEDDSKSFTPGNDPGTQWLPIPKIPPFGDIDSNTMADGTPFYTVITPQNIYDFEGVPAPPPGGIP